MKYDKLVKLAMFGSVEATQKRGKPAIRWIDNIKEGCNMVIQGAVRMSQEIQDYRGCLTD